MLESITLLSFCAVLLLCILLDISILVALAAGLVIFFIYGLRKKHTLRQLAEMSASGIKTVKNILITFILIGILTALWRAAGTIPVIICYSVQLMRPSLFLVMASLLNCIVSFLTGTAFGTAATMGVICATMGAALQVSPMLTGGAVLSGVFFGDRCSPVSTSALLTAELTGTNFFDNIKRMLRTALIPLAATAALYTAIGCFASHTDEVVDVWSLFGSAFRIHWAALLPALVILGMSAARLNVKLAMGGSILTAIPLCIILQGESLPSLIRIAVMGYTAQDPAVAAMLNGGGIVSMLKVASIVCLSSAYAGIFRETGLLNGFKQTIRKLSHRITPYGAMLCTAVGTSMIACNQTLSIMLTHQLCDDLDLKKEELAIYLEDTAVIVAPLIPWSIAGAVPLASIAAPTSSLLAAFFLYLIPLCQVIAALSRRGKER